MLNLEILSFDLKCKIIDSDYSIKFLNKEMFINRVIPYKNSLGEIKYWYFLKFKKEDISTYRFGEQQIELIK